MNLSCFKAYDIRGRVPDELDESLAYRIGRAYASFLHPARVVVGHDIRLSSPGMADAVARGLLDAGVDVFFWENAGPRKCISPYLIRVWTAGSWSQPATIPRTTTG